MNPVNRKRIGVYPRESREQFKRLLGGLAQLYDVDFESIEPTNLLAYDGALLLRPEPAILQRVEAAGLRSFVVTEDGNGRTQSAQVCFTNSACLDERLRGHRLLDSQAKDVSVICTTPQDTVLAYSGDDPIWVRRRVDEAVIDFVSATPVEPHATDFLREDHLTAGCFIGLLPLVHFLREICADQAWTPPPLRACFIFDDPNLHRFTYGFLDYKKLVAHTQKFNYHAAIATIPSDGWWVARNVAQFLRAQSTYVSWLFHGNNHLYHELNQVRTLEESLSILAQAVARIEALEQKAGISIPRIMVPPHGTCSAEMMQAMVQLGFEAVTMNPIRNKTLADPMLSGWSIADMGAYACPVIPRFIFTPKLMESIPLLAFLDQPLIYAGHHYDAANQMAVVEEWISRVNMLGDVQWQSVNDIARSNYLTRVVDQTLFVRTHSRHIVLDIPEEVHFIVVDVPSAYPNKQKDDVLVGQNRASLHDSNPFPTTDLIPVTASSTIDIRLCSPTPVIHTDIPHPPHDKWAIARRLLTEARDRLLHT